MLPKELHQLKYEAISVPQGSVRLVKKTHGRKSSTCYLLITKGVTSSSTVPLKTRRVWGRDRLQWCLDRSGWNHVEWGLIVFCDKSRFQLCLDDHRRRAWRRPGQRAIPAFTIARHTGSQPEVMDCSVISFDSRTRLVVIRGNLQHSDMLLAF
ncbi:transposable element Tc1 transposase [Trichonephila clavipes]|nr:transposable element Tc1 transposase [Trichonephila clavipes]